MYLRGFTLIELLVVIAIIGILSSIVLVSIGNARQSGADAGIKGNLSSIRTQAEVYASNNGWTYNPAVAIGPVGSNYSTASAGSACFPSVTAAQGIWGDPAIRQALISASNNAGIATLAGIASRSVVCVWRPPSAAAGAATSWVVAAVLKSDPASVWCVDNSGRAVLAPASSFSSAVGVQNLAACP